MEGGEALPFLLFLILVNYVELRFWRKLIFNECLYTKQGMKHILFNLISQKILSHRLKICFSLLLARRPSDSLKEGLS